MSASSSARAVFVAISSGAAPVAVDLCARGEREQHERDRLGEPERAHLAGARIELLEREERQRQQRHLRPDRGHRLAGPEPSEVAVSTKQHLTDYFRYDS